MSQPVFCVPDTNIFLHYRFFTNHPWAQAIGAKPVTVVVTRPVFRELDKHKADASNPRRQKRARAVISRLVAMLEGDESSVLRDGEQIADTPESPRPETFAAHGLDPSYADDAILAIILQLQSMDPIASYVLYSGDLGLRRKARHVMIRTIAPLDDLLEADEPDPLEKEVRELRQQLARLQAAAPALELTINDQPLNKPIPFTIGAIEPFNEEAAQTKLAEEHKLLQAPLDKASEAARPAEATLEAIAAATSLFRGQFAPGELERYHKEIDAFTIAFKEYLRLEHDHASVPQRLLALRPQLANTGSKPADDIDFFIYLPLTVSVYESEKDVEEPTAPKRPSPPRTWAQMQPRLMDNLSSIMHAHGMTLPPSPLLHTNVGLPPTVWGPDVSQEKEWTVRYHIDNLKHTMFQQLSPLYVLFPANWSERALTVKYAISCANHPEGFQGQFTVLVRHST